MWLSFIIFRFISLLFMFLIIFLDCYYSSKNSVDLIHLSYLLICGLSALLLFSLSIFWLFKITIGLLKVLFPNRKSHKQIYPIDGDRDGREIEMDEGNIDKEKKGKEEENNQQESNQILNQQSVVELELERVEEGEIHQLIQEKREIDEKKSKNDTQFQSSEVESGYSETH